MSIQLPTDGVVVKLFEDKTPNRIILNRILLNGVHIAAHDTLAKAEGSELIDLIVLLSRKLLSVWTHLEAYRTTEAALAEAAKDWPPSRREYSQELYEEFDVFSVQIKSTLDYLVQIMRPILGRKWSMYSFGGKGEQVLICLQRTTGKQHVNHVKLMEHQLFNPKNTGWLTEIIGARDQVNHGIAGGLKIDRFAVFRDADGVIRLPIWNHEQSRLQAMTAVWENLFRYVEDFIALAINFKLRDDMTLVRRETAPTSSEPMWRVVPRAEADAFIKANTPIRTI